MAHPVAKITRLLPDGYGGKRESSFAGKTAAPVADRSKIIGFPGVPNFMPDDKEHRRQMAQAINGLRQGKMNVTKAITLNAGATTTTLTDGRIGVTTCIVPSMPTTQNGATALLAGIWITNIVTGSCMINHASSANIDQNIRFLIIG